MNVLEKNDLNQILQLMERMKQDIGASMKQNGKWRTGSTFSKMVPFAEIQNGVLQCGIKYPYDKRVLENGRKPGKVPYNFKDIIYRWSFTKGLAFKSQKERIKFASAVAYKTAKVGSVQFRNGVKLDIYTTLEKKYEQEVNKLIATILNEKLKNSLKRNRLL